MRGHDDLADPGVIHAPQKLQKLNLPRRRQRRLWFVENKNALILATLFKKSQKPLAV
jgi:hypothetical protein